LSMMKIFSDRKYLANGLPHTTMLYPFWDKNAEDPRDPRSGGLNRYAEIGSRFFQMTQLHDADVAILPADWRHVLKNEKAKGLALEFVEMARQARKPVVIFFPGDSDETVPIENAVVFRTSFYRSRRRANEFAMPAFSQDFTEKYFGSQLPVRAKREKPTVGFCGYAAPPKASFKWRRRDILIWGANLLGLIKVQANPGKVLRTKVMSMLSQSSLLETNFIGRERWFGGAVLQNGTKDFNTLQKRRHEYVLNMADSDYIICLRGAGNHSRRLYETMSCGRIPLFIDTDCVLPYDWLVDWKQYCIWVDEKDMSKIVERVVAFHEALSPKGFRDMQMECRKLWEDWLSPVGFFANFHRHFKNDRVVNW
jgi:hypothetical protein